MTTQITIRQRYLLVLSIAEAHCPVADQSSGQALARRRRGKNTHTIYTMQVHV